MVLATVVAYVVFITPLLEPAWESIERMVPDGPRKVVQSLFSELGTGNLDVAVDLPIVLSMTRSRTTFKRFNYLAFSGPTGGWALCSPLDHSAIGLW